MPLLGDRNRIGIPLTFNRLAPGVSRSSLLAYSDHGKLDKGCALFILTSAMRYGVPTNRCCYVTTVHRDCVVTGTRTAISLLTTRGDAERAFPHAIVVGSNGDV